MPKAKQEEQIDPIVMELQMIKKLLIVGLMKTGLSQNDIAKALGVNQSTISRMVKE